jgi:hypothetical protein
MSDFMIKSGYTKHSYLSIKIVEETNFGYIVGAVWRPMKLLIFTTLLFAFTTNLFSNTCFFSSFNDKVVIRVNSEQLGLTDDWGYELTRSNERRNYSTFRGVFYKTSFKLKMPENTQRRVKLRIISANEKLNPHFTPITSRMICIKDGEIAKKEIKILKYKSN